MLKIFPAESRVQKLIKASLGRKKKSPVNGKNFSTEVTTKITTENVSAEVQMYIELGDFGEHGELGEIVYRERDIFNNDFEPLMEESAKHYTLECKKIIHAWMGNSGQKSGYEYVIRRSLYKIYHPNPHYEEALADF